MTTSWETLQEALFWRYAVKKFNPNKKIPRELWSQIIECGRLAPSSFGLQPWKFILVQNMDLRKTLTPITQGQSQVVDCSHYLVLCYMSSLSREHIAKHVSRVAEVRSIDRANLQKFEEGILQSLIEGPRNKTIEAWAQRQTYIAMGFLLESAALLGVDACPIEGLRPSEYDQILSLQQTPWQTLAAIAFGYRHPDDKYQSLKKVRFALEDILDIRD